MPQELTRLALIQTLWFFLPAFLGNMAPVFAEGHWAWLGRPIDGGRTVRGRRILGDHKTWRGIVAGVVAGAATFAVQQLLWDAGLLRPLAPPDFGTFSPWTGVLLGFGAGLGDAVKSFFKRQIGIAPGHSWLVCDQLDFMAGASACVALVHAPPLLPTMAALPIIFLGTIAVTTTGWWLGLKASWI